MILIIIAILVAQVVRIFIRVIWIQYLVVAQSVQATAGFSVLSMVRIIYKITAWVNRIVHTSIHFVVSVQFLLMLLFAKTLAIKLGIVVWHLFGRRMSPSFAIFSTFVCNPALVLIILAHQNIIVRNLNFDIVFILSLDVSFIVPFSSIFLSVTYCTIFHLTATFKNSTLVVLLDGRKTWVSVGLVAVLPFFAILV